MSGLRRPSGPCSLLVFLIMAGVQARCAATNTPPSPPPSHATSKPPAVLSPEREGDLLMVEGHYAAAIEAYQRETHRSALLFNKIGMAYHHMFGLDEARKYYKKALALNPRYPAVLSNLASVYYNQRDFGQAERVYKQALSCEPNQAAILANLGAAYIADAKYKLGMDAYLRALALDPNILHPDRRLMIDDGSSAHAPVYDYYLAKVCATAGKTKEAISYLQKALQAGFVDRKRLMKDKELTTLRSTPEFQQLVLAASMVNEGGS